MSAAIPEMPTCRALPVLQGCLDHKKQRPPRNLQKDYAWGPTVVPGGGGSLFARYPCQLHAWKKKANAPISSKETPSSKETQKPCLRKSLKYYFLSTQSTTQLGLIIESKISVGSVWPGNRHLFEAGYLGEDHCFPPYTYKLIFR